MGISGAPKGIRTPGPLIRSQVLYPAELSVHEGGFTLQVMILQGANVKACDYSDAPDWTFRSMAAAISARV